MLTDLFLHFFQIGLFSIGGGYAIIPLIQEQIVDHLNWIDDKTFNHIITISQMTPGPLAVNLSTFVGIQIAGINGAVTATLSCVASGIIISEILYRFFRKNHSSKYIFKTLDGLKSASLGLIVSAAASIILMAFFGVSDYRLITEIKSFDIAAVFLFLLSAFCVRKWNIGPITMIAISGFLGLIIYS